MATFANTNAYLSINGTDLSAYVRSAQITAEGEALSAETMGDSWTEAVMGLKSWSLAVEFLDDFAASAVDATTWAAFNTGSTVAVVNRPVNATVTTTNPQYSGSVLPNQYALGGQLGQMASKSLTYPGSGALARATST